MTLPDLEAWAIFAKVAETGSFAAAAAELGLSGPTVSKALARLEARSGERLIHRTSRRFALTDAGRLLASRAGQMLADAEALEAAAQDTAATPRGRVRLSVPMSFGLRHVAPILPAFLAAYPSVSVDLRLDDRVVDLVAAGVDVAMRIANLPDSSLMARRLCPVARWIVAAPAYFARAGRPVHPSDLAGHVCLSYAHSPGAEEIFRFENSGVSETVRIKGRLSANNADALMPALEAGVGIALLPDFIAADAVRAGRLVTALPDWPVTPLALNLLTHAGGPRPTRTRVLMDFFAQRFAPGIAPWTT